MSTSEDKCKSKNHRLRILLIVMILLITGSWLGWNYRTHILWKYTAWRDAEVKNTERIPNHPMPKITVPENWKEHSLGSMSFYLPPEASMITKMNDAMGFHCEDTKFIVASDVLLPELVQLLDSASQMRPSHKAILTLPQLRLAILDVEFQDFHWSMSSEEVRWLAFAIAMRSVLGDSKAMFTESISTKDWEGVLVSFGKNRAKLDWHSRINSYHGYIHFRSTEDELDMDMVRKVSQSIKLRISTQTMPIPVHPISSDLKTPDSESPIRE